MNKNILNLYKVAGETPLERIQRFKIENPDFEKVKLSYAGRLDPMAEGVLLVVAGEENKNKDEYLKYSKEYTFDAVFGVRTDTYDLLGKVISDKEEEYEWKEVEEKLAHYILEFKGKIQQQYPPYSSKPVAGKPLFQWAREDKIKEGKDRGQSNAQGCRPGHRADRRRSTQESRSGTPGSGGRRPGRTLCDRPVRARPRRVHALQGALRQLRFAAAPVHPGRAWRRGQRPRSLHGAQRPGRPGGPAPPRSKRGRGRSAVSGGNPTARLR